MGKHNATDLVRAYLDRLHEIHGNKHTPELSYHTALENLLNGVAELADPPVTITGELPDAGGGKEDTRVTAGWGFRGQKNAVMCGKGKVVEHVGGTACKQAVAPTSGGSHESTGCKQPLTHNSGGPNEDTGCKQPVAPNSDRPHEDTGCKQPVPPTPYDIYINDSVYWSNVPADVWGMTIGGYPVIKKWLSYREYKVLGRALRMDELTYVTEVVRRLKALILMGGELDENYRAAAGAKQIEANRKA